MSNRWALLVAIDQYSKLGAGHALRGAVNDSHAMAQVLTGRYGFSRDLLVQLVNEQATRAAILAAMEQVAVQVREGDLVVFHFSGHGSQKPDSQPDEADGWDETIVPYDSGRPPQENLDITDDEIHEWVARVTSVTPYLTFIIDCCNSGTVVRNEKICGGVIFPKGIRGVPRPSPGRLENVSRGFRRKEGRPRSGPSGWLPLGLRYTLLAACRSDQQARELDAPPEGGAIHGALTRALLDTLEEMPPGATWREVYERVKPRVQDKFRDQEPQLEGDWDREVFGSGRCEPMLYVPVRAGGGRGLLEAGASCGVRKESIWAVYPLGTRAADAGVEPIGLLEVTEVRAVTSDVRVLQEVRPGALAEGGRAVESSLPPSEMMVPVEIVAPGEGPKVLDLVRQLEKSMLLRPARPGERVDLRVRLEHGAWVVEENGHPSIAPRPTPDFRGAPFLVGNLEKRARYLNGIHLANSQSPLAGQVEMRLYREDDRLVPPGEQVFQAGERVLPEVFNRSDRDLYVYLLDFGLTGHVKQLYPPQGEKKALPAGDSFKIGLRVTERISLFLPPDAPPDGGQETFKLFATTHPADFRPLTQGEFRSVNLKHGLNRLVIAAAGGGGVRSFGGEDAEEDWTTVERTFRLVP
jgi:hypothetical protein